MRWFLPVVLSGLLFSLSIGPASAEAREDRSPEMEQAARAFLKAYQAKDLDALMETAEAPFLVGTVRAPKAFKTGATLRADLKSRLSSGKQLPPRWSRR